MTYDPRPLSRFAVEPACEGFLLTLQDAGGEVVRFAATEEQMDVLADLIDDALGTAADD